METTTSFDLSRAIRSWRENLAQSPAFRGENLNELESHLRDSITAWQTRGLSAEEAFMVAANRIGKGGVLESEFGKVNGMAIWLDRFFWMLIGYQVWAFISGIIGLITRNALFFGLNGVGYDLKAHGNILTVSLLTAAYLAGFAGSLAFCWWLFYRKGQRFGRWLGKLLHRRANWLLTYSALYLLPLSIFVIGWGTQALLFKSFGREKLGEFAFSFSLSSAIAGLITTAVLVGLTLFLARKRLRVGQS